ncbi:MAG: hypothetical protein HQL56_18755 [Magnetococcales bacterium]|nr:hypothetical protein [Magnetococcales bacterium]
MTHWLLPTAWTTLRTHYRAGYLAILPPLLFFTALRLVPTTSPAISFLFLLLFLLTRWQELLWWLQFPERTTVSGRDLLQGPQTLAWSLGLGQWLLNTVSSEMTWLATIGLPAMNHPHWGRTLDATWFFLLNYQAIRLWPLLPAMARGEHLRTSLVPLWRLTGQHFTTSFRLYLQIALILTPCMLVRELLEYTAPLPAAQAAGTLLDLIEAANMLLDLTLAYPLAACLMKHGLDEMRSHDICINPDNIIKEG